MTVASRKTKRTKTTTEAEKPATYDVATPGVSATITLDAADLLDALIPDPFHCGTPALTMLDYVADEMEAIECARAGGGAGELIADNLLYRLRVRVRAVSELLGREPALSRRPKEVV